MSLISRIESNKEEEEVVAGDEAGPDQRTIPKMIPRNAEKKNDTEGYREKTIPRNTEIPGNTENLFGAKRGRPSSTTSGSVESLEF